MLFWLKIITVFTDNIIVDEENMVYCISSKINSALNHKIFWFGGILFLCKRKAMHCTSSFLSLSKLIYENFLPECVQVFFA